MNGTASPKAPAKGSVDELNASLTQPWFHTWSSRPPRANLPGNVVRMLQAPRPPGPVIAVHVFTDGSSKVGYDGGWAAVLADEIIGPTGTSLHFAAYCAGTLAPFLQGPLTNTSNNIAAEHAAAVVAAAWLLSTPDGLPACVGRLPVRR